MTNDEILKMRRIQFLRLDLDGHKRLKAQADRDLAGKASDNAQIRERIQAQAEFSNSAITDIEKELRTLEP